MKLEIEVRRIRQSVTQGEAAVYVNGEKVIQFGDDIQMVQPGQKYYGEKIGYGIHSMICTITATR